MSCTKLFSPRPRHNSVVWTDCTRKKQERRHSSIPSRPRILSKARQYLITKVGNHRSFLTFITSGIRHDETILHVRPRQVSLQEDFPASGDRLLDPDQKQKKLDLIRHCVDSILHALHRKELEAEQYQCQRKFLEVNESTAGLYSKQGNTDFSEHMVVDEMIQFEVCKKTQCKKKVPSANEVSFGKNYHQKVKLVGKQNGASTTRARRYFPTFAWPPRKGGREGPAFLKNTSTPAFPPVGSTTLP